MIKQKIEVSVPDWGSHIMRLERHGLTQHQIAKRIGVHQSTVCRIKAGQTSPKWDTGEAIIMCLGEIMQ